MVAVTALEWITAGGVIAGSLVLMLFAGRLVARIVTRRADGHSLAFALVARIVRWAILLVGLIYAASVIGIEIGPIVGALGLGGLAVALAVQPVLQNLFAGAVLQTSRPIDRGDEIITNGYEGTVVDVTGRAVVIETYTGEVVHIPNSAVLDNPILNQTRRGNRRTRVDVGVAYGTDVAVATEVLSRAVTSTAGVLSDPAPFVVADKFGESSIDFRLEFWHDAREMTEIMLRAAVIEAIQRELDTADITIAFPQRDVWMRSES